MTLPNLPKMRFDARRMVDDMTRRGWNIRDFSRAAGVSLSALYMFLGGQRQTIRMGQRLAGGLGFSVRRYLLAPPPRPRRAAGAHHRPTGGHA